MRVHNPTLRLVTCAGTNIVPGDTVEIPPEKEEAVRNSFVFRAGLLREVADAPRPLPRKEETKPTATAPPKKKKAPEAVDIRKLSVPAAIAMIEIEQDYEKLALWAQTETRPDVIAALHKRGEQIAAS